MEKKKPAPDGAGQENDLMNNRRNKSGDGGPVVHENSGNNSCKRTSNKRDKKIPLAFNPLAFFLGFLLGLLLAYIAIKILTQIL